MTWISTFIASVSLFISSLLGGPSAVMPPTQVPVNNTQNTSVQVKAQTVSNVSSSTASQTKSTSSASVTVPTNLQPLADASIKSDLASMVTDALLYQDMNSGYGSDMSMSCTAASVSGSVFSDPAVKNSLSFVVKQGSAQQTCRVYGNGSSFSASAQLVTDTSKWYCVDSTGFKGVTSGDTLLTSSGACN
jgi:hypothetical protein